MTDWSKISEYVETGRTFFPNPEAIPRYRHKYRLWRETYDRLKTLYPRIPMPGPGTVRQTADGYRQ